MFTFLTLWRQECLGSFPMVLKCGIASPCRHKEVETRTWGRSLSEDGVLLLSARSLRSYLSYFNVFQRLLCGLRSHTVCSDPRLHGQVGSLCFYALWAIYKQTWMPLLRAISIRMTTVRSDSIHTFLISSPKRNLCFHPLKLVLRQSFYWKSPLFSVQSSVYDIHTAGKSNQEESVGFIIDWDAAFSH